MSNRNILNYGTDEYGRYVQSEDGERCAVEFYPFWREHPFRLRAIVSHAYFVALWHLNKKKSN